AIFSTISIFGHTIPGNFHAELLHDFGWDDTHHSAGINHCRDVAGAHFCRVELLAADQAFVNGIGQPDFEFHFAHRELRSHTTTPPSSLQQFSPATGRV